MKKNVGILIFLFCLGNTSYSEEEVIPYEKTIATKKREEKILKKNEKEGKKRFKEIQLDIYEPLEDKVYRSKKDLETRLIVTRDAFDEGEKRMEALVNEENEMLQQEKEAGIKLDKKRILVGQKYGEVQKKFESNTAEMEKILIENKKLKENLENLKKIEVEIRRRN